MVIPCQFLSHLKTGPCMKKTQPAPLQETNLDLHVPMQTLIFQKYLVVQSELNDLVRYLNLLKSEAELLACHLHGWNLLQQGVKVSCRKCQQSLSQFISVVGELVYCNNVEGLLQELEHTHNPEE